MVEVTEEDLEAIQQQIRQQEQQRQSSSGHGGGQDPNLIEFQLEMDNILERLEHLLRGEVAKVDVDGEQYWEAPEDSSKVLNEKGIQFFMNYMSTYLNRNTILSNYTTERINEILIDIGYELTDHVFCNYERFGLDTQEKRTHFNTIVMSIVRILESTYNRSIAGGERESLRTARMVTQNIPMSAGHQFPQEMPQPKPKFKLLKPRTWGGG